MIRYLRKTDRAQMLLQAMMMAERNSYSNEVFECNGFPQW
jgi:hypothetical protein